MSATDVTRVLFKDPGAGKSFKFTTVSTASRRHIYRMLLTRQGPCAQALHEAADIVLPSQ